MPPGPHQPQRSEGPDRDGDGQRISSPIAVELLREREIPQAWEYDAQILTGTGSVDHRVLCLNWADYQLWSPDGSIPPSRVAEAVLQFIASHPAAFAGLERIDAAVARRKVRGADDLIADLIRNR
jgi:hypothetical protein